ncbi:Holliday junction branch migration DNA helicase RuvB [Photobacterium damselae]|uniref:Holliday junction branch migration DNA helicase RuvB n=1 Tax=Photobacterium damselae TaxID=38293 RepID=UPI004067BA5D
MENQEQKSLRPDSFEEYIGQSKAIKQLKMFVKAASMRRDNNESDWTIDHIVFDGQAGLGKTSLAYVIAKEMNANIRIVQANSFQQVGEIAAVVMSLDEGDILFIDEIHGLDKKLAESLYSIMEDFRIDLIIDKDGGQQAMSLSLPRFTLIGATTELGRLELPFIERLTHSFTLDPYSIDELNKIIELNVNKFNCTIEEEAKTKISMASKSVPRNAIALLKKCRDYAQGNGRYSIELKDVEEAFADSEINKDGLKKTDINYLRKLHNRCSETRKPVGLKTISDITGIDSTTIESAIEPFLIQSGYIDRTPRGRIITELGIAALK